MSENINLLVGKKKQFIDRKQVIGYVRLLAGIMLFAVSSVSLVLFFIKLSIPMSALQQEESTAIASLEFLAPKAAKFLYVKNKLQDIRSVQLKRTEFGKVIDIINNPKPTDVNVNSVVVDTKTLDLGVSSSSLSSINSYLLYLADLSGNKKVFSTVILDSISMNPVAGGYSLSLRITFL